MAPDLTPAPTAGAQSGVPRDTPSDPAGRADPADHRRGPSAGAAPADVRRGPAAGADRTRHRAGAGRADPGWAAGLALVLALGITRTWDADWSTPFAGTAASTTVAQFADAMGVSGSRDGLLLPFGNLHQLAGWLLGRGTHDVGLAVNLYYALGFPLAAATAVWFLRRCGLRRPTAVVLAALYAVTPYHFLRGEGQLALASYWAVPLALGLVLAVLRGRPLWGRRPAPGARSWWWTGAGTVIVLLLVTASSAYYGMFTIVLLVVAGIGRAVRARSAARLPGVAAAVLLAVAGVALPLVLVPGPVSLPRQAGEVEFWSLKLTGLILPAPGHPVAALAALRQRYDTMFGLPGERPALGLIAAVGFLALLAVPLTLFRRPTRVRPKGLAPLGAGAPGAVWRELSLLTWAAYLAGTLGGLGSLISLLGAHDVVHWDRLAIFLALLGLAAGGRLLDLGVTTLAGRWSNPALSAGRLRVVAAVLVLIVGTYDQSLTGARPVSVASAEIAAGGSGTPG